MRIGYAANGMPDYGADQMYQAAKNAGIQGTDYGTVSSMPEIPGLMLRNRSHGNAKRRCENRSQRTRLAGVV